MRASFSILMATAIFVSFTPKSKSTPTNNIVPLQTKFIADASLDASELSSIVELAKCCGIDQVAEVRTFHYLPGTLRGIVVTGADQIFGRNVTYKTIEVFREGWALRPKPTGPLQAISVGPFWVVGLGITHTATLCKTVNGFVKVEVENGIATNMADTVVSAFTSTNFLIQESHEIGSVDRSVIESENLLRPYALRKAGTNDHYWISFFGSGFVYEFVLASNKVVVLSVHLPPTP